MDEAAVRELLIVECHNLLTEWHRRQDRPWYAHRDDWYDFGYLETTEFSKEWPNWPLFAGTMGFLDGFVDSMNHGFSKFDNRIWEEAVDELRKMTAQLEAGRPGDEEPCVETHG